MSTETMLEIQTVASAWKISPLLCFFLYTPAQSLSRNNKTLSKGQTKECRPSYIHAPTSY